MLTAYRLFLIKEDSRRGVAEEISGSDDVYRNESQESVPS